MAQLGKNQNIFPEHGQGVKFADFRTDPASRALFLVHLGNRGFHCSNGFDFLMKKKMNIGFFHIAVQQGHLVSARCQSLGKIDCHRGFSRSPFSARDSDFQCYDRSFASFLKIGDSCGKKPILPESHPMAFNCCAGYLGEISRLPSLENILHSFAILAEQ